MSSTSSVDTGALFAAVFGGQLEELERLLGTGVQVENVVDVYGDSLLHAAASGGNVEVVRLILDSEGGMRLLDRPNNDGKTPLHYAYSANATAELLTRGADGNAVDNDLRTPLHLASLAGARDVVETLAKHGVELNNLDRYNRNAMHFAAGIKPEDQDVAILKLLLDGGASVSVQEGDITALHLATRSNWLEAANLLLDHGADVNVLDMDCRTVLLIAIQESFIDLVKLFVSYGAAVNKKEAARLHV
ncbi:hypothetical protein Poli38472_005801 [Pythium oligandrum]|uniref:Uncharacterized protein n=1 Tax=Pythium oligandrum TaxID=41045 RepID=A0A8K1CU63_PYTOL|nr:hypothetical protein Poli38472_005801 [Pythium oligandrum]|eukprot:TMW68333.1 hypothetical protein Poli38472_005801 [Pythium oligandrum]